MERQSQTSAGAVEFAEGDFSALLKKEFRPQSDDAKSAIESAVKTLAEQALAERERWFRRLALGARLAWQIPS